MTKNLLEFRFRSFEVASRNRGYVCLFFFHLLDQISFPICLEWAPNCQRFSFVAWDCFLCWDINVKRKNKKKLILTEVRGLKGKEIDPIHGPFYFWLAGPVGKRNPLAAAGLTQSVKRLTTEREETGSIPGAGPILTLFPLQAARPSHDSDDHAKWRSPL